jgi:hypothetical protein
MTDPTATIRDRRHAAMTARDAALADVTARWNRLGNLRVVTAVALIIAAIWWAYGDTPIAGGAALVALVASVALAIAHRRLGRARATASVLTIAAHEAIWRLDRDWERLPLRATTTSPADHPYAGDLDVLGRASLLHLLDTTVTPAGRAMLASWLLAPATPAEIGARQAAVAELAARDDLRDSVRLAPSLGGDAGADSDAFVTWATTPPLLADVPVARWLSRIAPLASVGLVVASAIGATNQPFWILPVAVNVALGARFGGDARERIAAACSQQAAIRAYAALLDLLDASDLAAPRLRELRDAARVAGHGAGDRLRALDRIARWRMPAGSIASIPAQWFLGWNLVHLGWLERWQTTAGAAVPRWIAIAAEVEALTALAALKADHPDWAFPTLDEQADAIVARDLGHPLLADGQRVVNDVTVGPAGQFLLVTGSNMSGKSTLLRSVGLAVVLANAGGPVCASALSLPPLALWTSVRVQDSLARGVSFFMAELLRLKLVVDAANAPQPDGSRICYILDEMLQGTNTAERQIAARRIVRHLVGRGAIGAVSTHDLTLADGPELAPLAVAVHFTEHVEDTADGATMRFDYRLLPGIATSTNALRLMDLAGFALDDAPTPRA